MGRVLGGVGRVLDGVLGEVWERFGRILGRSGWYLGHFWVLLRCLLVFGIFWLFGRFFYIFLGNFWLFLLFFGTFPCFGLFLVSFAEMCWDLLGFVRLC